MDLDDESDDDDFSMLGSIEKLEELSPAGPDSEAESLPSLHCSPCNSSAPDADMHLPHEEDSEADLSDSRPGGKSMV